MTAALTWATILVGLPLCLLAVVATIWQAPYLIVVLLYLAHLLRRAYRRADERFQRDVAAARAMRGSGWDGDLDAMREPRTG